MALKLNLGQEKIERTGENPKVVPHNIKNAII